MDSRTTGRDQADITGLIGQYAHGNEPSHHKAWLYHYAGRPDRSAERVREILDTLYAPAPDGLARLPRSLLFFLSAGAFSFLAQAVP